MQYTDYNSLYMKAQKRISEGNGDGTDSPSEKKQDSTVQVQSVPDGMPAEQIQDPVQDDGSDEAGEAKPAQKKEPEPDMMPYQDVFPMGNNSGDLDRFAEEFGAPEKEAVFVEPSAVPMPVYEPEHGTEPDLDSGQDDPFDTRDDADASEENRKPAAVKKEAFIRPKAYVPKKKTDDGSYAKSHLRSVPAVLVNRVQQMFPSGPNKDDAVAAYIYLKEGCPVDIDVPEHVKSLAKTYAGSAVTNEDMQADIMAELNKIKSSDRQLMQKINAIELAVVYNIFDRLGFRKGDTNSESSLNFTESGMHELLDNLEASSINYQTRLKKSEGRMKR